MRRKYNILMMTLLVMTFTSCNKLDLVGMFFNRSDTEDRVKAWLNYNAENGEIVIDDVPDNYTFYSSSDSHYNKGIVSYSENDRIYKYVTKNRNDSLAIFSIIAGDIVGEKGEEAFKIVEKAMTFNPDTQDVDKPCFTTLGNHDIYFDCVDFYKKYFHTSTYTVTVKTKGGLKDLFIFLDSGNGTHGPTQLEWLEEKLSRRKDYRYCIVISHNWIFRTSYNYTTTPCANLPLEEQYALMDMMSKNEVNMMLMGHAHHCETQVIDRVHYVMTNNMNESTENPTYLNVYCGEELRYQYKELFAE